MANKSLFTKFIKSILPCKLQRWSMPAVALQEPLECPKVLAGKYLQQPEQARANF